MAGQGPSRRELLQALSLAAAASAAPGFSRWCFAFDQQAQPQEHPQTPYKPQFFSPAQYQTIETLAELILPRDKTPGATDAGVAEFIDFMVFSDTSLHEPFRQGLAWLDHATGHPKPFTTLSHAEQIAVLDRLAYKKLHRAHEEQGQQFFHLMRKYTVMGYYTTKIGLETLDYPGLKFYATSPGCPHPGNPEHIGI